MGRRLKRARTSGILLSTIILAGLVSIALVGNYNYFRTLSVEAVDAGIILPIIVRWCGVRRTGRRIQQTAALADVRHPGQSLWQWRARNPILFAGVCGPLVAVIDSWGGGFPMVQAMVVTAQVAAGTGRYPMACTGDAAFWRRLSAITRNSRRNLRPSLWRAPASVGFGPSVWRQ